MQLASSNDNEWLENTFIPKVQKRGAEIIAARGASSAASAANAIIDSIKKIITPTASGDWFSMCLFIQMAVTASMKA